MADDSPRLYNDLAGLWPLMSPVADYAKEAVYWLRELRARLPARKRRRSILELGCGGGHFLHHLAPEFAATAVDLSPQMLHRSRELNPGVRHHVGDMRTVRLGKKFDAVLIHDAIDYMTTEDDLLAAFATAREHLRPGGLLLAAPDHYTETFTETSVMHETNSDGRFELTWVEYSTDLDPADTEIEAVYVFFRRETGPGAELTVEFDRHTTGLFPIAVWERLLYDSGFTPERVDYPVSPDGSPMWLWVCRLR